MNENGNIILVNTIIGDCRFSFLRFDYPELPSDSQALHMHLYYELHIAVNNSYTFRVPKRTITLNKGEMLLFEPNSYHCTTYPQHSNLVFSFSLDKETKYGENYFKYIVGLFHCCAETSIPVPDELIGLINRFTDSPSELGVIDFSKLQRNNCRIIEHLIKSCEDSIRSRGLSVTFIPCETNDDKAIYLDYYINRSYSLADIARVMNYSEKHIARMIQSIYGMSLTELRNKRRIETAILLLQSPDYLSNEEIAIKSEFNSISNFYRCFKEATGKTPDDYRLKTE